MTFLSTYAEVHAAIIGAFSGLVAYLAMESDAEHVEDVRSEVAYFCGFSLFMFTCAKIAKFLSQKIY